MTEHANRHRRLSSTIATATIPAVVLGSVAVTGAPAAAESPRALPAPATPAQSGAAAGADRSAIPAAQVSSSVPAALTTEPVQRTTTSTYTVQRGDTLSHIAERHQIGLSTLLEANGLSMDSVITPGQQLMLSDTTVSATPVSSRSSSASTTYTVKSGDTLSGIAVRHEIGLSTLLQANGLSQTSVIRAGQELTISGGSSSGEQLVPDTFLHYSYPEHVVSSANENKRKLMDSKLPGRSQMQTIVANTARSMGVDPSLALAHAMAESSFDASAVSPANAIGAMQVIPDSGEWASQLVGRELNLLDPHDNAIAGIAIIRQLQRTSSSEDVGIASYYQGADGVKRHGMLPDTEDYVAKVKNYMSRF